MTEMVLEARPRPRLQKPGFARELLETIVLIGAIYALVNLATVRFFIDGPSMQPNFYAGQFLVISRASYLLANPERGDVVVFNAPGNGPEDPPLIKRLIGMPGETVALREQQVYVDERPLEEPYILEACRENRCRDEEWQLGPDEYFFMGDNRNNSKDSRVFGPVPRDRIVGEAMIRYWPPEDWGIVEHFRFPPAQQ